MDREQLYKLAPVNLFNLGIMIALTGNMGFRLVSTIHRLPSGTGQFSSKLLFNCAKSKFDLLLNHPTDFF